MAAALLEMAFFGGLSVQRAGQPLAELSSQKALALLCYLAMTKRPQPRTTLAGLLWGGMPESRALMNLRKALKQLRQQVGEHLIITRQQVSFNPDAPHQVDAACLAGVRIPSNPGAGLTGEQLSELEQVLDLFTGDFLEGFYVRDAPEFEQWILSNRAYLREQALRIMEKVASEHARQKRYAPAIVFTRRLLRLEPWRESSHRDLMELLAADGQRGAALAQYETCRRILQEELGVEPSDATERLFEAIQAGELQPHPQPAAPDLPIRPQRPSFLNARGQGNPLRAAPFVGRQPQLALLDEHLQAALTGRGRVVFVGAEAGLGKTSLLAHFARTAQERYPDLIVASGVCTTYTGQGDPYLPFREILRMLACDLEALWSAGEISREHALRLWRQFPVAVEALAGHGRSLVGTFVPSQDLLGRAAAHAQVSAELLQQLAELARYRQEAGETQERIFEEYSEVLAMISAGTPLLLMLDDLHWADQSSISLLFHLGRRLTRTPIMILGAYRPEDIYLGRDGQPHPLRRLLDEFKRLFGDVILHLALGSPEEGRQFVDALLDSQPNRLDEAFRSHLAINTRGHPLFTVEILREMRRAAIFIRTGPDNGWHARRFPGIACRGEWRA